ncbi:hypothetical protein PoB_004054800 [Plakobranchus ocellatus]|uniref:Uncharacterized protein n=1 Tax=Plakobranchus ocellatus TaxID=259542 RepID=A0AAV4B4N7_9GAST|nr:hypothetical protein PoB_004054800 [Plakobranchus ocellatus]
MLHVYRACSYLGHRLASRGSAVQTLWGHGIPPADFSRHMKCQALHRIITNKLCGSLLRRGPPPGEETKDCKLMARTTQLKTRNMF